jgi:signal transduction histidine kinase
VRISTKLTLALGFVSASVLGVYGLWLYSSEKADLLEAADRNFRTLSTAVRVAVENSLRDKQTADIREILDSLEVGEPELDVFVIDRAGNVTADSSGTAHTSETARELIGLHLAPEPGSEPIVRFGSTDPPHLVGLFPLYDDDGGELGTIAIVRPLRALADDLERTRDSAIASSLVLIGSITLVGWLLMLTYVRRPLEGLSRAMQEVRRGDLSGSLPARSKDELGAIATRFNAMVRELELARRQLLQAAESREILEQALQRVDKLVTIGQLSAGLAHEIGSPLLVLGGRARALATRTDLPADAIRTARILDEQTARIARIVEQLLTFARRRAPHVAEIELGQPITAVVDLLEGEARRRGVRIEYQCPAALPRVLADSDQVQQIMVNLLHNALRATPRGGRVRVSLVPSAFTTADGVHDQPSVMLTLEDNGHGMSEAVYRRIFEPFFTTSSEVSTGLGLAVVKTIVDDHGGTIAVSSVQGRGTTVRVHLPTTGRARMRGFVA